MFALSFVALLQLGMFDAASAQTATTPKPAPTSKPATSTPPATKPAATKPATTVKAKPTATQADIDQVVELAKSGASDALVIKTIQSSGKVYTLATPDVLRLKKSGVSEPVIEAMLDTASPATPAAPTASATPPAAGSSSPGDREPTEAEMAAALKAGADNANAFMKDTEDQCRRGGGTSDPALAILCLAGAAGTGGRGGIGVQVSGVRKIACAKATNVPGWNCDYVVNTDVSGVASSPFMRQLMQDNVTHGRFLYTGGRWVRMPDEPTR
jgi:hypothetical protein